MTNSVSSEGSNEPVEATARSIERLLVTGDRFWVDRGIIRQALVSLAPKVVIQGGAKGADTIAAEEAKALGIQVTTRPAWWSCNDYEDEVGEPCRLLDGRHMTIHGRPAGVVRNQRMLDEEAPDFVAGFHSDLDKSTGTADCLRRAKKAGLPCRLYSPKNPEGILLP